MTSEFDFIANLRKLSFSGENQQDSLNFEDDICILSQSSDKVIIASKDIITEGTHFFSNDPLDLIVKKAIRTNISDITAKGAKAYGMMIGLMLPEHYRDSHSLQIIEKSLEEELNYYNIPLLGGDTVSANHLSISVTILGECPSMPPLRKNAQLNDKIYVTGTLGLSHAGLKIRLGDVAKTENNKHFLDHYLLPDPPYAIGKSLFPIMNASCDISDGLIADLGHILKASHVGAEINLDKIPYAPLTGIAQQDIENAATGGDDYQILFTSTATTDYINNISRKFNVKISEIGKITSDKGLSLLGKYSINQMCYNNF